MIKRKYLILILLLIIAGIGYATYCNSKTYPVVIVIPNKYEGYITIVEDKDKFDHYYGKAWEDYNVLEYHVSDDSILKVKSIRHFLKWPQNIDIGYEWVEPVVYYKEKEYLKFAVFGDLLQISENEYRFWTGNRGNFTSANAQQ